MANLAANSIIGNNTASAAVPKALTAAEVRTLLNVADGATANSISAVSSVGPSANATLTYGGTFTVPQVSQAAGGQFAATARTMTMPANPLPTHPGAPNRILTTGTTGTTTLAWTAAPGNNKILGTSSSGVIEWQDPPAVGGSGTVTSVGITAGSGLSVSGSPIISSGNITVGHSNSITGATRGPSAAVSGLGESISVPYFTFDAQGHITASGTYALTSPTAANVVAATFTNTTVNSTLPVTTTESRSITNHISLAFSNIRWLNDNKLGTVTATVNGDYVMNLSGINGATKAWTKVTIPTIPDGASHVLMAPTTAGNNPTTKALSDFILYPSTGSTGQLLAKTSSGVEWITSSIPAPTATNMFLGTITASTYGWRTTTQTRNSLWETTSDIGSTQLPVYIAATTGLPTALTQANLRIGIFGPGAIGSASQPVYFAANGVPTALSGNIGSATQPVYISGGTITALTGSIANNTTGSAANLTAFTNAVTSQTITTVGASRTGTAHIDMLYGNVTWLNTNKITEPATNATNRQVLTRNGTGTAEWTTGTSTAQVLCGGTSATAALSWTTNTGTLAGGASGTVASAAILARSSTSSVPVWTAAPAAATWGQILVSGTSASAVPAFTTGGAAGQILRRTSPANTGVEWASDTIGSSTKPVYLSTGVITASTGTAGSITKPVYLNGGTITEISGNVGAAGTVNSNNISTRPVYLNAGTITETTLKFWAGTLSTYNSGSKDSTTLYFCT